MLRRLPSSSRFTEAMANDDDLAEILNEQEPSDDKGPPLSEYTPEVARLDVLIDRVSELISATISLHGGRAPRVRPARRPETAFSRAAKRRSDKRMNSLIAEVEAAQQRAVNAQN